MGSSPFEAPLGLSSRWFRALKLAGGRLEVVEDGSRQFHACHLTCCVSGPNHATTWPFLGPKMDSMDNLLVQASKRASGGRLLSLALKP